MARDSIDGFCVLNKKWIRKGFEVVGVGQTTPDAWRDAAEQQTRGRMDARQMIVENPQMKCVPCKMTVTFDNPEVKP